MFKIRKLSNREIALMAVLIALQVVASRFLSINLTFLKIGFTFIPLAACSILMGPFWGTIAAVIADIIGANLFPSGPFYPGFTLSAALTGAVYGVFTYNKRPSLSSVVPAVVIDCAVINILIGTLWLADLYGKGYMALLMPRIVKNGLAIPIQSAMIFYFWKHVVMPYKEGKYSHGY